MIYYFSGTGNSLAIAKELGRLLNESIAPIGPRDTRPLFVRDPVCIIVAPIHNYDIPPTVKSFIARLWAPDGDPYFAMLINYGGFLGNGPASARRAFEKQKLTLAYNRPVVVPDNAGPIIRRPYDLSSLATLPQRLADIADDIRQRKTYRGDEPYSELLSLKTKAAEVFLSSPVTKLYAQKSLCIGCERCVKLCPVGNVKVTDLADTATPVRIAAADKETATPTTNAKQPKTTKRITFGNNCIHCLACVQWCPVGAIRMGYISFTNRQYTNPDITPQELFRR